MMVNVTKQCVFTYIVQTSERMLFDSIECVMFYLGIKNC